MSAEQIQQYLEMAGAGMIKPSGDNLIATCPFHADTHRSFSMNTETGQWCCFSQSCGEQGSLLTFLMQGCGYSFEKAKDIADTWSEWEGAGEAWEEWPEFGHRRENAADKQSSIQEALLGLYDFCPRYMTNVRKFTKPTLRRWEIGYDSETERVTLPVRDERGELLGFSKRTTKNEDPKYLHLGFKRSRVLYGEFFCPKDAEVWVAEGQLDALALYEMGVQYPVSTMSAKVGQRQIQRLALYPRVVLAFDADSDGRGAAEKVGGALVESGHREVYVARNFGRYKDPADILGKGTDKRRRRFLSKIEPFDLVRLEW